MQPPREVVELGSSLSELGFELAGEALRESVGVVAKVLEHHGDDVQPWLDSGPQLLLEPLTLTIACFDDPSPGCLDASLRTKLQTERGGPRQKTQSHDRELVRPGSPPALDVKCRYRLLAGGARIHVDFHADRHFDDLRGFPGHLALLFERTTAVLPR